MRSPLDGRRAKYRGGRPPAEYTGAELDAIREERFHILPHPEVAEYVKRKGADVDRWIGGMQRWQGSLFTPETHPASWLKGG